MNLGQMSAEDMRIITGLPVEYMPAVKEDGSPSVQIGREQQPQSIQVSPLDPMQRMQTKYATAVKVQKPRNLASIIEKVMEEANCAGEDFYYTWEVDDRRNKRKVTIEGGSIGLAYAIARHWGNCVVDVELDTKDGVDIFTASWIDLESGYSTSRMFRKKHNPLGGNYNAERADDMGFQIGQSKAIRNVIFAGVPKWLETKAIAIAKAAEEKGLEDPTRFAFAKNKSLAYLVKEGITEDRIYAKIGKSVDDWTKADYLIVRSMCTQIHDGVADPDELFPPLNTPAADQAAPQAGAQPKKPRATTALREEVAKAVTEAGLDLAAIEKSFGAYCKDWSYSQCEQAKKMAADALAAAGVVPDPEADTAAAKEQPADAPQGIPETVECPKTGNVVRTAVECAACDQNGLCPSTDGKNA